MAIICNLPPSQVRVERAGYHYRIQRAIDFGDSISLVVDAQENSSNSLPHFNQADKSTEIGWKIQVLVNESVIREKMKYTIHCNFISNWQCRQD
jgi:hypothetical protein